MPSMLKSNPKLSKILNKTQATLAKPGGMRALGPLLRKGTVAMVVKRNNSAVLINRDRFEVGKVLAARGN